MDKILISNIPKDYYISNKKIYTRNQKNYKISNTVDKFDKDKFAAWIKEGFADSKFKTQIQLVEAADSDPATISRLMNGTNQSINNKASQPPKQLVKKLAELFNRDINQALIVAGYAPENGFIPKKPTNVVEFFEVLEYLGLDIQFDGGFKKLESLDADDLQELLDGIVANASAKVKRKMQGK